MEDGDAGDIHAHGIVLDIGEGVGALVIYTKPTLEGLEIEVSRTDDDADRVHTEVLERLVRGQPVFAAVFAALPEGAYRVWTHDPQLPGLATIRGGQVAELDWR